MSLEAPVVDFTPILLTNAVVSSACEPDTTKAGSVETCTGNDAPYNSCAEDSDWL